MKKQLIMELIAILNINIITATYLDMTYQLDENIPVFPIVRPFEITVISNGTQPGSYWLQLEEICTSVNIGTHMEAPCHFARDRWCIHEIPFQRFILPAVVVDITDKGSNDSDALLSVEDLQDWEQVNGKIPNGSIVIVRSGWGKYWTDREKYLGTVSNDTAKLHFPSISPEAARWLVNNTSIYAVGVETISLDAGQNTGYEVHSILYEANMYGIENIANVDKLPVKGATIFAMPINIKKGSSAPSRVFAKLPDETAIN